MKRVLMLALIVVVVQSPAMAITHFRKIWAEHYTPTGDAPGADAVDPEFRTATRKAGCFICHVKGEDKKETRNEYGNALQKYLKAKDFDAKRIKAEPEKVKEEIIEALKKVEEEASKDGDKFGEKIKANKLPATDAKLD